MATSKQTSKQKDVYFTLFEGIKAGKNPSKLAKELNISKQNINRYIRTLKAENLIRKIGYGTWEVIGSFQRSKHFQGDPSEVNINLHNISFILKLVSRPCWWERRENALIKLKDFQQDMIYWGNEKYLRLKAIDYQVQLFSNSIVLYMKKHYNGTDPYDLFILALQDALKIYEGLEKKFNFKFFKDGVPQLSVRSQHFVKLRDAIAEHCKREKNLLKVEINGKLRAWVDFSEPFGLETGHRNYAPEDMNRYKTFVADIIQNNPPLNSELTQSIASLAGNWHMYSENIKSHIAAIQQLSAGVDLWNKNINRLIRRLK